VAIIVVDYEEKNIIGCLKTKINFILFYFCVLRENKQVISEFFFKEVKVMKVDFSRKKICIYLCFLI